MIAYFVFTTEILLAYTAFAAAGILIVSSGIHGAKNKDANPFIKFLEYRKNK